MESKSFKVKGKINVTFLELTVMESKSFKVKMLYHFFFFLIGNKKTHLTLFQNKIKLQYKSARNQNEMQ